MKRKDENLDFKNALERADAMLFALAELIKHQNREPHVSEEWFNVGLAEIITSIMEKLPRGSD